LLKKNATEKTSMPCRAACRSTGHGGIVKREILLRLPGIHAAFPRGDAWLLAIYLQSPCQLNKRMIYKEINSLPAFSGAAYFYNCRDADKPVRKLDTLQPPLGAGRTCA
jgi:hypothetical protein